MWFKLEAELCAPPLISFSSSFPSLSLSESRSPMRVRTLEIRWHDSKPISTCDFQPVSFKKARPVQDKAFAGQSYRLATGGEDNHVRVRISFLLYSILQGRSVDYSQSQKDLDGLSKHHPSIACRGRVERRGQSTSAPASQGGISCNPQQALGPSECCSFQPEWCARMSPLLRVVIPYLPPLCTGELIASAGDGARPHSFHHPSRSV